MEEFSKLLFNIENTSKTNNKVSLLKNFFLNANAQDKVWAIALFSHKRPKRQINTKLLTNWAIEYAQIPEWLFQESYHVVGDLSETLALILPPNSENNSDPLHVWINRLIALKDRSEEQKKEFVLWSWKTLNSQQLFVFHKLITGGFRVGISKNLIIRAVAEATEQEKTVIAHKIMGDWDPSIISFEDLILNNKGDENISKPYPFYLSYALDSSLSELGKPGDWQVEWKWDGIRSQLIKRNGELFLWSRGEELITEKFPELEVFKEVLPDGVAIDGELMAYKNSKPLSFAKLQTRIGRKNVTKKQLNEAPAAILAYDLLEYDGNDIRKKSLTERRKLLKKLINEVSAIEKIFLSKALKFNDWDRLQKLKDQSRANHAEGLMLKKLNSPYKVGRKRGDWWKWKVDPFTIDAVMIYAQKGHGRRADIYSDYTFAVWHNNELVTFTKAYSGLTDKEMMEVTRFVKANTLERFGPVRTVSPELVFEIHFEGISKSSRHKSGVAVRFPRIHRWRKDKTPEDANTLEDLISLLPKENE